MKVLLCHTYYQQPGGEDRVFEDEADLLASRGHQVVRYALSNEALQRMGNWEAARKTLWNGDAYRAFRGLVRRERPDIVHCANTFPLLSPSVYYAARAEGVPVVQSLHNYRLLCPAGTLFRDARVCEECLRRRVPWPAVKYGCYRGSRTASAVVAGMLSLHRLLRTWTRTIGQYIALSDFSRRKFIEGGLPAERIVTKPNFVHPDPGPGAGRGGYVVFVGRLSQEKGLDVLLSAWQSLRDKVPLKILGDGPLAGLIGPAAAGDPRIEWLGRRPQAEVLGVLGDAACLVMCSPCYENCPKTLLEAFARGTPAIVPRLGAMAEMVDHQRTGLHFEPGSAADLAVQVERLMADPARRAAMRHGARQEYERRHTADLNYQMLSAIYRETIGRTRHVRRDAA